MIWLRFRDGVASVICLAVGAALLSAAALWNGYPLLFPDTVAYLGDGHQVMQRILYGTPGWPANGRPIYYGLAAWLLDPPFTLWPVVFVQAILVAWIVKLSLRCFQVPLSRVGALSVIALLVLVTPVSWYVSHVMPDIFAGVLVLCMVLVECCADRLSTIETLALLMLATASVTFHVSHLVIALALLAQGTLLWVFSSAGRRCLRPLLLAIPVFAGLSGLLIYPWIVRHDLALAPNSLPWPLARAMTDGPAMAYLRASCDKTHYVLCDNLDSIPTKEPEAFIWSSGSPVQSPAFQQIRRQSNAILLGTMEMYPIWMLRIALGHFAAQLVSVQSEAFFTDFDRDKLRSVLPRIVPAFDRSEQRAGHFDASHLRAMNRLHGIVYGLATIAAAVLAVPLWRRSNQRFLMALVAIIVALVANALVTGVISGVHGRYQGRVCWLLLLWVIMAGCVLLFDRRHSRHPSKTAMAAPA